jgi:hypothetical protein
MKKTILLFSFFALMAINGYSQQVSPFLFGQNYWLANGDENRQGYLHLLWPTIKESGVKMVRIGGNLYNHQFPDNKKLLGMIDSIKGIGVEPLLQVPYFYSTKQTVDLVTFLNISNKRNIRYWSIGNEPSLEHEKIKIEDTYKYLKTIASALKSVDPNLKIFVYDECYLTDDYARICGGDLDLTGKTEKGVWLVDGISFHSYPNGEMTNREQAIFNGPASIRNQVIKLLKYVDEANKKNNREGDAKLLWALTETNVTYMNPDRELSGFGNTSFLGGQFMAEMFGIGMEYGAFTVNQWCIHESDRVSSDFGYIGAPADFKLRSSYYHMKLMSQYLKGNFTKSSSNYSYVKTIATVSDTQIFVMLMNQDNLRDLDYDLQFNNIDITVKPLLVNVPVNLEKKYSGILPNQSTMILIFNRQGELQKQISYSLKNNLKNQPPEVK